MQNSNHVQFARLLDELHAVGLTEDQTKSLCGRMNVKPEDLGNIFDRATAEYDKLKPLVAKTIPLTEDQISEELAENGTVSAIVSIDFAELIGHLSVETLDGIFDEMAERITGSVVGLQDLDYNVLFSENDTLYVKVSGVGEAEEDEEDDDAETD